MRLPGATLTVIAFLGTVPGAAATSGDLDTGFGGGDGIATVTEQQTTFAGEFEDIVAVDSQGRPIVAYTHDTGTHYDDAGLRLAVMRLTTAGVLDTSFNSAGSVPGTFEVDFPDAPGAEVRAAGIVAGPNDTIVAVGQVNSNTATPSIGLVRLTSAGAYDATFQGDGRVVQAFTAGYTPNPFDLTIDDSDRLLVAGRMIQQAPSPHRNGFIARFTSGGDPDPAWGGGDGHTEWGGDDSVDIFAIEAVPGGAVVGAGANYNTQDALGLRTTSTGAPDTGFGGSDGIITDTWARASTALVLADGVTQDAAGRVILVGQGALSSGYANFTVARYEADGDPDPTWAVGGPDTGVYEFPSTQATRASDVAICGDGVVATGIGQGIGTHAGENAFALARFTSTGELDTSFAPAEPVPGLKVASAPEGTYANGLRLALDGPAAFVAGFMRGSESPPNVNPVVMKHLSVCGTSPAPADPDPDPDPDPEPAAPSDAAPPPVPPLPIPSPPPVVPPAPLAAPRISEVVAFPSTRRCASRRKFQIRLRVPPGAAVARAEVVVNGKRVAVRRSARLRSTVDLRGLPKGRVTVTIRLVLTDGRVVSGKRRYRTCATKRRRGRKPKV